MKKNKSVPMPLIRMAMLGLKPIRIGASTVAPNIAITCCTPIAAVCSHGRRSSGATMAPAEADTLRQRGREESLMVFSPRCCCRKGEGTSATARRQHGHGDAGDAGQFAAVVGQVDLPHLCGA